MKPEDWAKVSEHAIQLLKPGGALQWVSLLEPRSSQLLTCAKIEGDFLQSAVGLRESPEACTTAIDKWAPLAIGGNLHFKWFISNLRSVLAEVGFTDIRQDVSSTDRTIDLRKSTSRVIIGAWRSALLLQSQRKIPGAPTDGEVAKAQQDMLQEVEGGAYSRMDLHQFIAFKGIEHNGF